MPTRRTVLSAAALAPLAALLPRGAVAGAPAIYAPNALAIGGYDPVAYFTEGAPVRGDDAHLLLWAGAFWCFASAANREAFEADPRGKAPQYGGYCAYALAWGALAPSAPEAWTIRGGKLYLNRSSGIRDLWRQAAETHIRAANARWPAILG